jgi:hypothetical protein
MMRSPLRLALTPAGLYLPRTSLGPQDAGGELYEPPAESAIGFGGRLQRREIAGLRMIGSCSNPPALATIPFAEND